VHFQAQRFSREGFEVIIIGHPGHPEVEGTRGRVEGPVYVVSSISEVDTLRIKHPARLSYVTQTTFRVESALQIIKRLKERLHIQGPELNNICYATQSRQNCVRRLAKAIDLLLVVGARNSSNSNRLREVGEENGVRAYLIEDADDLAPAWFSENTRVGITAGASAPEELVQNALERLATYYPCTVQEMVSQPEPIHFTSPLTNSPGDRRDD